MLNQKRRRMQKVREREWERERERERERVREREWERENETDAETKTETVTEIVQEEERLTYLLRFVPRFADLLNHQAPSSLRFPFSSSLSYLFILIIRDIRESIQIYAIDDVNSKSTDYALKEKKQRRPDKY